MPDSVIRTLLLAIASLLMAVTVCGADDTTTITPDTTPSQTPVQLAPFPVQADGTPVSSSSIEQTNFQNLSAENQTLTQNLSGSLVSLNASVNTLAVQSVAGSTITNLNQLSSNLQAANLPGLNIQLNSLIMSGQLNSIELTNVNALASQINILQASLNNAASGINNLGSISSNLNLLSGINNTLGNVGNATASVLNSGVVTLTGQINDMGVNVTHLMTNSINVLQNNLLSATQMLPLATAMSNVNSSIRSLVSNINSLTNGSTMLYSQIIGLNNFANGNLSALTGNISSLTSQLQSNLSLGNISANFSSLTTLTNQLSSINGQLSILTSLNGNLSVFANAQSGLNTQLSNIAGLVNGGALGIIGGSLNNALSTLSLSAANSAISAANQGLTNVLSSFNNDTGSYGDPTSYVNQATNTLSSYGSSISAVQSSLSSFASNIVSNQAINAVQSVLTGVSDWMGGFDNQIYDSCPTPSCVGAITPNKDTRYTDVQIKGAMQPVNNSGQNGPGGNANSTQIDPGAQGAMPAAAMPNKETPVMSLVNNFPMAYFNIDPQQQCNTNQIYRGCGNGTYNAVTSPVCLPTDPSQDPTGTGSTCDSQDYSDLYNSDDGNDTSGNSDTVNLAALNQNNCRAATNQCGTPDYNHIERWTRLQYDNCTSQYILPMGMNPSGSIFYSVYQQHQYPWNETVCQPLRLSPPPCVTEGRGGGSGNGGCLQDTGSSDGLMYDYRVAGYLKKAWHDMLDCNSTIPGIGDTNFPPAGNYFFNWGGNPNPGSLTSTGNPPLLTCADGAQGGITCTGDGPGAMTCTGSLTCGGGGGGTAGLGIKCPGITGWDNYLNPMDWTKPGNTDTPATGGTKTNLKDIASSPYERIWDTTHPYSPRWDFSKTDRYYSHLPDLPTVLGANVGYILPPFDSPCIVRCAAVPVDILTFRQKEWDSCMRCRIQVNTQCFWSEVRYLATPIWLGPFFFCPPDFNAFADTISNNLGCHPPIPPIGNPTSINFNTCKTFFDSGILGFEAFAGQWPPCSTKYDHPKDTIYGWCNTCESISGDKGSVQKCCDHLAQALAGINTLKIRNTQEDPELKDSNGHMPEGYTFKEYFGNHMPYMRWWDTGTAAGGGISVSRNYNPNCDMGKDDTIVGVGKEGKRGRFGGAEGKAVCMSGASDTADCNTDGGGQICIAIPKVDATSSWEELKQYQMNSLRDYGLDCLPQYEKVHKISGSEDAVLQGAGGYFLAPSAMPTNNTAPTR